VGKTNFVIQLFLWTSGWGFREGSGALLLRKQGIAFHLFIVKNFSGDPGGFMLDDSLRGGY
jgi:hypothetical protein